MTTNAFFKQLYDTDSSADQQLVEELIVEMIQIHGTDFYYLPRTLKNFDSFLAKINSLHFSLPISQNFIWNPHRIGKGKEIY